MGRPAPQRAARFDGGPSAVELAFSRGPVGLAVPDGIVGAARAGAVVVGARGVDDVAAVVYAPRGVSGTASVPVPQGAAIGEWPPRAV
jgi:hypothetical protein